MSGIVVVIANAIRRASGKRMRSTDHPGQDKAGLTRTHATARREAHCWTVKT